MRLRRTPGLSRRRRFETLYEEREREREGGPIARAAVARGRATRRAVARGRCSRALAGPGAAPRAGVRRQRGSIRCGARRDARARSRRRPVIVGCSAPRGGRAAAPAPRGGTPAAVALGLYGDWLRVGIGVARRSVARPARARARRDARGGAPPGRSAHVRGRRPRSPVATSRITLVRRHALRAPEEAFCVGSAARGAAASGSSAAARRRPAAIGEPSIHARDLGRTATSLRDAGGGRPARQRAPVLRVVTARRFHLVPTDVRTVVTAASGRAIEEARRPARPRRACASCSRRDRRRGLDDASAWPRTRSRAISMACPTCARSWTSTARASCSRARSSPVTCCA